MKRNFLGIVIVAVLTGGLASACASEAGHAMIATDGQTASATATTNVSSSPKPVDNRVNVPLLLGLSPQEATALLQSAGLTITVTPCVSGLGEAGGS